MKSLGVNSVIPHILYHWDHSTGLWDDYHYSVHFINKLRPLTRHRDFRKMTGNCCWNSSLVFWGSTVASPTRPNWANEKNRGISPQWQCSTNSFSPAAYTEAKLKQTGWQRANGDFKSTYLPNPQSRRYGRSPWPFKDYMVVFSKISHLSLTCRSGYDWDSYQIPHFY